MGFLRKYRTDINALLLLLGVFLLARILFGWLMPHTYSKDLYAWLRVIKVLQQGGNPYSATGVLNWPPFWMQILYGIHLVSAHIHVSEIRLIQAVLTGGEAACLVMVYYILRRFFNYEKPAKGLIVALALNPVSIFLSCQHCNFDVFVGFWVLLFTCALLDFYETKSPVSWLMACFFLAMGILTKTVPLILTPILLVGIKDQKIATRLFGTLLLFTPVVIGMSIIFTLAQAGVQSNVLNYRSMPGWYGITGFLGLMNLRKAIEVFCAVSPVFLLSVILFTTWRCLRITTLAPKQLVSIVLLLLLFLPTFGPGYSPPYIIPIRLVNYTKK